MTPHILTHNNKRVGSANILKKTCGYLCSFCMIVIALLFPYTALAQTQVAAEDLEEILLQALSEKASDLSKTIKNSHFDVQLNNLPKSTSLSQCHQPEISFLTGAEPGTQRIKVECLSPQRWSIYARGHISLYVPVLVSRRTLARGETINSHDVIVREHDISELRRGYLLEDTLLQNKQLTRRINAGDVITPQTLQPAQLINRGDRVSIIASNHSFTISMPGEALENGRLNQQIRVRNLSSGKTVRGIVSGNTEVHIL